MPKLFRFDENEYGERTPVNVASPWEPVLRILDSRKRKELPLVEIEVEEQWYRSPLFWLRPTGMRRYIWIGWQIDGEWFIRGKSPDNGAETPTILIQPLETCPETCPQCNEEYVPGDTWHCPHCGYHDIPY